MTTIGVDFRVKTLTVDEKRVRLVLWDTAGSERFRTLTGSYYRGAQLAFLVFDVTNKKSFENLNMWLEELELHFTHGSVVKVLVGNKIDKFTHDRHVSVEEAVALAKKQQMLYLETSAKTKKGVAEAFDSAVKQTLLREDLVTSAPSLVSIVPVRVAVNGETSRGVCC